ncbi:unnamed protein product [Cercospora beticola]|nr:unnamed protein product [Cercospora beticola]
MEICSSFDYRYLRQIVKRRSQLLHTYLVDLYSIRRRDLKAYSSMVKDHRFLPEHGEAPSMQILTQGGIDTHHPIEFTAACFMCPVQFISFDPQSYQTSLTYLHQLLQ